MLVSIPGLVEELSELMLDDSVLSVVSVLSELVSEEADDGELSSDILSDANPDELSDELSDELELSDIRLDELSELEDISDDIDAVFVVSEELLLPVSVGSVDMSVVSVSLLERLGSSPGAIEESVTLEGNSVDKELPSDIKLSVVELSVVEVSVVESIVEASVVELSVVKSVVEASVVESIVELSVVKSVVDASVVLAEGSEVGLPSISRFLRSFLASVEDSGVVSSGTVVGGSVPSVVVSVSAIDSVVVTIADLFKC